MKCLERVKNALLTVMEEVYHYEAVKKEDSYIVWAEDSGANVMGADNEIRQQAVQGTIDYYTKKENDENVTEIQKALKKGRISFYMNSVQYEDETKYIHYEWVFEVT